MQTSGEDMKKILLAGLAMGAVMFSGVWASASIIWDYSPGTTGAAIVESSWSNDSPQQNFGEIISFATGATVTGIDIYSNSYFGSIGQDVTVRLWSDVNGTPGTLLQEIFTSITVIDTDGATGSVNRKHADISPLLLTAGVKYWIGMSGTSEELTQAGLNSVADNSMAQFFGTTLSFIPNYVGDMAFRLEGDTSSPVPEPATMLLFGTGIAGLAAVGRRKRS
jgi:hypothetical protein